MSKVIQMKREAPIVDPDATEKFLQFWAKMAVESLVENLEKRISNKNNLVNQ